jgi:hypothetical protein
MATPEEIAANIAASHARRAASRERVEEKKREAERHPQEAWHGKLVGLIVHTRKDKYKPFVASVYNSHGDNDSMISTVGSQNAMDTLEEARACLLADKETEFERVFLNPVKSGGMMGTWLNELLAANPVQ